jgi:hypothetical protein
MTFTARSSKVRTRLKIWPENASSALCQVLFPLECNSILSLIKTQVEKNAKFKKSQVGKMPNWQNGTFKKWQVHKMAKMAL